MVGRTVGGGIMIAFNHTYVLALLLCSITCSRLMSIEIFSYDGDSETLSILEQTVYDEKANKDNEEAIRANNAQVQLLEAKKKLAAVSTEHKKILLAQTKLLLKSKRY